MTYRELLEELKTLNYEQLEQLATVHLIMSNTDADEFAPVQFVAVACEAPPRSWRAPVHVVLAVRGS